MKPAEFVEASLNIPLCAEIKTHIDKLYLLFISDKQKFIEQISNIARGSSKTNIVYYLPIIFSEYQREKRGMKDSKIYSKLGELSLKYANRGLTIDFEFNRFEMILRGWLDLSSINYDIYRYNRAYSYEMIESLSDEIDIETLVDEFKEEVFEQYKLKQRKSRK